MKTCEEKYEVEELTSVTAWSGELGRDSLVGMILSNIHGKSYIITGVKNDTTVTVKTVSWLWYVKRFFLSVWRAIISWNR